MWKHKRIHPYNHKKKKKRKYDVEAHLERAHVRSSHQRMERSCHLEPCEESHKEQTVGGSQPRNEPLRKNTLRILYLKAELSEWTVFRRSAGLEFGWLNCQET